MCFIIKRKKTILKQRSVGSNKKTATSKPKNSRKVNKIQWLKD